MNVFELNAEMPEVDKDLCIPFAWPFDTWECIVPSGVIPRINILEKLILSLIDTGSITTEAELQSFLQKEIGLDAELIENAFAICKDKGYINRARTNLQLNIQAKGILETCNDGVITGHDYDESRKRVFLFRDLVTDSVVPYFDVESLPQYPDTTVKWDSSGAVVLKERHPSGVMPNTAQRRNALRSWGRMFSGRIRAEASISRDISIAMENRPGSQPSEDGMIEEKVAVAKDNAPAYDLMQFHSNEPDRSRKYFEGYFVINRYCPTEISVISPFGVTCDNWFRNLVNRLRLADEDFDNALRTAVGERIESLKDRIAFGNDPVITLFDKHPIICNDPQYSELKDRIMIMNRYLEDKQNRSSHLSIFTDKMRQAIEFTARHALQQHPELEATRAQMDRLSNNQYDFSELHRRIRTAASDFSFGNGVLRNMVRQRPGCCMGVKDALALMVIDSVEHPEHTGICQFVNHCHDWIRDLPGITDELGNASSHVERIRLRQTPEEYYQYTAGIIDDLFTYLIN